MQIIRHGTSNFQQPTVLALGSFDALHIAHTRIIEYAIDYAKDNGILSGAYMFEKRPEALLSRDGDVRNVLDNQSKCRILDKMGLDMVCFDDFEAIHHFSAKDFASMLKEKFRVQCVVVGFHYHFGYKAEGDVDTLRQLGKDLGFEVKVFDPVKLEGRVVSSTYIRELLSEGDVETASKFLGRAFFLSGTVQPDRGVGSKMGLPTANILPEKDIILPRFGVYATRVHAGGQRYHAITNVGIRPTFGLESPVIETNLFDFTGNLYGACIDVEFMSHIRDEKKFNTPEELKIQIFSDIDTVKKYFKQNC